jgi:DNA-directed RNA polymerase specialized sigma24 family protein
MSGPGKAKILAAAAAARRFATLTVRKSHHHVRDARRLKRGGGAVCGESAVAGAGARLDQLSGPEPTPELAAEVAEECQRLLGRLGDSGLRQIALWKMEGHTNAGISAKLGCAPATVERRLALIRRLWEKEAGDV